MRFGCLGSGSKGNAWLVEAGDTRILVDCGFGVRETGRRMGRLGIEVASLSAILVTHEHSDHGRGAAKVAQAARCPVWLSHGSQTMLEAMGEAPTSPRILAGHQVFAVGDLEITPYPVPHDAREPVQFLFSDGDRRFGLLTDAGHVTAHMERILEGCDALALECNHDVAKLEAGGYPAALKRRILGRYGHLDNAAAAALLARVAGPGLKHVVAAHLSEENNAPELARSALAGALGCEEHWIGVADQEDGLNWREI
ncbi:MAG TPA: MBL fold metallo-hydrolase [Thiobacillaceae bacterium]|nr:MBL fold metallo-hydrolase [Thiobacillaceae bacterium]HNI08161.1 MBL fold metallo-hydrolase [Thiobacillaceae bacterium]